MKLFATLLTAFVLALPAVAQDQPTVVGSGPVSGASGFLGDLVTFISPNPSNGLFNASEFNLEALGTLTHVQTTDKLGKVHDQRQFGADVGLSYFFTTGLGSRFDVQYANGQATYTSLAGIARTTFGTTNDAFMIAPYTVLGATHGVGDGTQNFTGYLGIGFDVPFHFDVRSKRISARFKVEADGLGAGKPTYLFGLTFDWQKK